MHQEVKVSGKLKEAYTVETSSRLHYLLADQSTSDGGLDLGPTPTELLLTSLISCKLITMKMYAKRKNWDLQNVFIELQLIDNKDKAQINKTVQFEGSLSEEQRQRLILISERCPIVKMLKNSIEFKLL